MNRRRRHGTPGRTKQHNAGPTLRCNRCHAEMHASRKRAGNRCHEPNCKRRLSVVERDAA